jgi:hypothetical protein
MKLTNSSWLGLTSVETIARFGAARLVRKLDGRHELIGGTPAEHSAAREWCSLFAPKIVFSGCRNAWTSRLRRPAGRIRLMHNMRLIFKIIGPVLRLRRNHHASANGPGAN